MVSSRTLETYVTTGYHPVALMHVPTTLLIDEAHIRALGSRLVHIDTAGPRRSQTHSCPEVLATHLIQGESKGRRDARDELDWGQYTDHQAVGN